MSFLQIFFDHLYPEAYIGGSMCQSGHALEGFRRRILNTACYKGILQYSTFIVNKGCLYIRCYASN